MRFRSEARDLLPYLKTPQGKEMGRAIGLHISHHISDKKMEMQTCIEGASSQYNIDHPSKSEEA